MRAIAAFAALEIRRLYRRPLAWLVLSLNALLMALFFMLLLVRYLDQESVLRAGGVTLEIVVRYFSGGALMLLLLTPILTMNVVSSERRDGHLRFLFSAPVSSAAIVIGKLLGVLSLATLQWMIISLIPVTLLWGAPIDLGVYASNVFGLALFMLLHICLGVMASAMTRQPIAAGVIALLGSLSLWLADWAQRLEPSSSTLGSLSTLSRMRGFAIGLVNTADVAYFVVAALLFTVLAVWSVEGSRRFA